MSFLDILTPISAETYASWTVASGLDVYQNLAIGPTNFTLVASILDLKDNELASITLDTNVNIVDWLNNAVAEVGTDVAALEQGSSAFVSSALANGVDWVSSALAEGENLIGSIATSLPTLDLGVNLNIAKKRSNSCGNTCETYSDCTSGCRRCIAYSGLKSTSQRRCY